MKSRQQKQYLMLPLCLVCLLTLCSVAAAQSGRRTKPEGVSPNPPPPAAPEEPKPARADKPDQPKQKLIVATDDLGRSINIPQYMARAVLEGFIDEMTKLSSMSPVTERLTRKGAVERARKETSVFVVLLQVETEYMNGGMGTANADEVLVSYTIYTPGTGKVKNNGRVYARSSRSILGVPTGRVSDSQLYQVGRETARRVMSALGTGTVMR